MKKKKKKRLDASFPLNRERKMRKINGRNSKSKFLWYVDIAESTLVSESDRFISNSIV